jgi:iron complex transport system substrate-binding protein
MKLRLLKTALFIAANAYAAITTAQITANNIISVGGAATEIVYALGQGDRLVGVDTTSTYPAASGKLAKVGYMRQLSAEGVLSLKPQLVLLSAQAGPPAVLEQLQSSRVSVVKLSEDYSYAGLRGRVTVAANALGATSQGAALLATLDSQWQTTSAQVARYKDAPRVLFVLSHGSAPSVAGLGTAADALIKLIGASNAALQNGSFTGYKPVTAENLVAAAPEVIVTTSEGLQQGGIDGLLARPVFALTPAGRNRRVVALDSMYLLGFGPRLPQVVAELAQLIRQAR